MLATLIGSSLVIASACVFNNYLDRHIDAAMERTKKRALVIGKISTRNAIIFASLLGLSGMLILSRYVNALTVAIGIVGFISYVFVYGYAKRKSVHGTLVGTISGSTSIIAGYCAVTNHIDLAAILLFMVMVFWQMVHFLGIAMYRRADYAAANIPVLPVVKGMAITKIHVMLYLVSFIVFTTLLTVFGYATTTFAVVMTLVGVYWLWIGYQDLKTTTDDTRWGKNMFIFSLVVLVVMSVTLSFNALLP